MQFQVLDVDYVLVNEKPVIRAFGKDEKGDTVCGFYEGFQPYFYATGTGIEDKLEGNPQVVKIERVKRTLPIGYQEPSEVYKITLRNPAKTVEVRENLRAGGIVPYEADILFKYRWMNDIGIGAMRWIDTQGSNGISTDSVYADRRSSVEVPGAGYRDRERRYEQDACCQQGPDRHDIPRLQARLPGKEVHRPFDKAL